MNPIERKHIKLLLTPSLLSAGLGIIISLALIISATIISLGKAGRLKNDLFAVNYFRQSLNSNYHSISQSLNSNHFISELGLWIFWAAVGLVAYLFAVSLYRLITELSYFKKSLDYVHAEPDKMVKELFFHLMLRLISLIIGLLVVHYCFKIALPFCLAVISSASRHWTIVGDVKLAGIILLLFVIWHVLTLIFRMLLLKPRIFGY